MQHQNVGNGPGDEARNLTALAAGSLLRYLHFRGGFCNFSVARTMHCDLIKEVPLFQGGHYNYFYYTCTILLYPSGICSTICGSPSRHMGSVWPLMVLSRPPLDHVTLLSVVEKQTESVSLRYSTDFEV